MDKRSRNGSQGVFCFLSQGGGTFETGESEYDQHDPCQHPAWSGTLEVELVPIEGETLGRPHNDSQGENGNERNGFKNEHHFRGELNVLMGDNVGRHNTDNIERNYRHVNADLAKQHLAENPKAAKCRHSGQCVAKQERPAA